MNSTDGNPSEAIRKLSILIPVFNERRTLRTLLHKVLAAPLPCERELVIVDDCSTDGSREYLVEFAREHPGTVQLVLHKKNAGKGTAIRTAIRHFTGDWAIIQDADLEYDPNEYERLLAPVQDGVADAVFGSRFMTGRYRRAMYFWHTGVNNILTCASNILNDLNLTDMETCYKLVRGDILRSLIIRSKGFDLEPELTTKLARWGARIYEVPISYRGRSYAEGKKIGPRDAYYAIRAMILYRFFDSRYTRHDGFLILQAVRRAKRFNRWMFSQIEKYLGDEVLEAGCGIGNLTEMLLDRKRLVAVDYEKFYVDRIRQAYGHLENLKVGEVNLTVPEDLESVIGERPFDTIICLNVMEHIENDRIVLDNFYNALRPGGKIIVLVPHDPSLFSAMDETLGHYRRYTQDDLTARMKDAGFRVIKTWGFNRMGGLGWRVSGQILRRKTLSASQMGWFEFLMPLTRLIEKFPYHSHTSVICVGEKPAEESNSKS